MLAVDCASRLVYIAHAFWEDTGLLSVTMAEKCQLPDIGNLHESCVACVLCRIADPAGYSRTAAGGVLP